MDLATYRLSRGLTQEALALELGLKSKGYISNIENGLSAPLKLAIKIERWSGGQVKAASLSADAAGLTVSPKKARPTPDRSQGAA